MRIATWKVERLKHHAKVDAMLQALEEADADILVLTETDRYTAICVELTTDRCNLLVYGTIMGVFGNRDASFKTDMEMQMEDVRRLATEGHRMCVIGDYNLSFADGYYYTRYGRDLVRQTFLDCGIDILTQAVPECIDHIAISKAFARETVMVTEWNKDKSLSDHKGVVVEMGHCEA